MSEQTTGATQVQIEAASEVANDYASGIDWEDDRASVIDGWIADITEDMCAALVKPNERVVSVSDLRRLCELACVDFEDEQDRAFLAAICGYASSVEVN